MAQRWADNDLAQAGFLVFSIDYRLAPPGFILHQDRNHTNPDDGRPPEQSNDVKQQILAANNDTDCNHKIFLLGGSAGATHALWCALDAAPLPPGASGWPLSPGTIRAVAGLSGPYDLYSRVADTQNIREHFANDVNNYTNIADDSDPNRETVQKAASPYYLVDTANNIPPIRLFTSAMDPVPHQQAEEMRDKLRDHGGVDYLEYQISGNLHSFDYWHTMNSTGNYVSQDVIAFFNAHKN